MLSSVLKAVREYEVREKKIKRLDDEVHIIESFA